MKASKSTNHFRPTLARIDLMALRENFRLARGLAGKDLSLIGVVKANAYGHGSVRVSQVLEEEGVGLLAVATPEEGIELRQAGIRSRILVLGGAFQTPGEILREHQLVPVIFRLDQAKALAQGLKGNLEVQIKVDTGMTRLGIFPEEIGAMLRELSGFPKLQLSGILTHLAQADTSFAGATEAQFERFASVESLISREAPGVKVFHIANSAAILGQKFGECHFARPGILLYGANPHPRLSEGKKLKPVMNFETEIISLKKISPGTAVSYGGSWVAERPSRIAVLAVGYADGYLRSLSNRGQVLLRGKLAPVVGRVCMDLTMVDVTEFPEAEIGDPVRLWGREIPAEQVADWAGTISYELFCAVGARVPRLYEDSL